MLLLLDLLSTVCFAGTAASIALRCKSNFIGVSISAMLASMGGGTTREILLGSNTLFWMETTSYLFVVLAAILMAYLFRNRRKIPDSLTNFANSFATAVFIVVGVTAALGANANFLVCLLMGVLTGVGGGILRQVVFRGQSVGCNRINILSAGYTALICVILVSQSVNLFLVVILLGSVHLSITSEGAIRFLLRFKCSAQFAISKRYE